MPRISRRLQLPAGWSTSAGSARRRTAGPNQLATLLIADLACADGLHQTRAACIDTFTHRNKHSWPPALTDCPDWPTVWNGTDLPDDVRIVCEDAMERVTALVVEIDEARTT